MFDMEEKSTRRSLAAAGAVVVMTLTGFVLNLGHNGALQPGIIEVGEVMPHAR